MKGFAYTARDASGGTKHGFVPAPDRTAAIREIRALGLIPIDLREADSAGQGPGRGLPPRTLALAAAALAAVVALVMLLVRRPAPPPAPAASPAPPAATTAPAVPAATVVPAVPAASGRPGQARMPAPPSRQPPAEPAAPAAPVVSAVPAAPAVPATPEEPPKEEKPKEPEHVYKTLTEQLLAMLGRPGEVMPPLPISGNENLGVNLKEALTNLIAIYDTDDAHAVNSKETVAWLKVQLAEAEKEGWNPAEVIKALEAQRREEAAIRQEAARRLQEMIREKPGQAREIRAAINAELLEQGLLPLDPPIGPRRRQP